MPSIGRYRAFPLVLALLAVALLRGDVSQASPLGLLNPGFESGVLDGSPANWTVVSAVDAVKVVDSEGPAEFATYADMGNITVSPYKGNLMLRLGTPKRIAESQNRGANTVSQTFSSVRSNLKFAFRLFSWEQRGNDLFMFDLKDGRTSIGTLASPLIVKRADGTTMATCTGVPCQFSLNVGVQGDFIDSGWTPVEIDNLPADGRSLTLTYSAGGTKDQGHATWAYFDNVNTPPVAKFSIAPTDPMEGDAVQFLDLSYDPDPGDAVVNWSWVINGEPFPLQNPYFIFPNEGTYSASLTVTDKGGDSTTVKSGGTATDGDAVPSLVVTNAAPLVNALNTETLAGRPVKLTGRFLDPGWLDVHSAAWSISGNPAATVEEEHDPLLSSGLITGSLTPASSLNGTLTVNDGNGGTGSDPFTVNVLADTAATRQRFEPNDVVAGAPVLTSDGSYVSFIQSEGDIDVYEVRLPGGGMLTAGSELLATLSGLPADYDLAILSKPPTGATTGFSRTGFSSTGFSRTGFSRTDSSLLGFSRTGFSRTGFSRIGFSRTGMSTFNSSGASWGDLGFSRTGFSRTGFSRTANEVTPVDVSLDELGLGSVGGSDIQVADFSANRGLDDETAWARSSLDGTGFYVAVFGSNGAHSSDPYTLSLEVIQPPNLEVDLGAVCNGSPLVTTGQTSTPVLLHNYDDPATPVDDPAQTLIVTQEQRMRAVYNMDDAAWNAFLGDLVTLAQHPGVRADIVSLPSSIYDNWDSHPCSIEAANSVAAQVRDIVQAPANAGVDNVVIAGSDQIVPFRRVSDQTVIGNERDYLLDSFLKPGTPLFASVLEGFVLTDDYYGDRVPNAWQGGELYVPDQPVGRLVEKPEEIRAVAKAFLDSNGTLSPSTGFVAGYDFFKDGSTAIADALDARLPHPVDRLINDSWTAADLRCHFLGQGTDLACGTHDVNAPNAHFTHYAALSAGGFAASNFNDFLGSQNVATAGGSTPVLKNRIVFSMGCHSGFNSPDGESSAADPGTGVVPALDYAQAMARQQAVYVANTGYGLGDDAGIGGSEKLMSIFAQTLLQGNVTAGHALVQAKQEYLSGLATMTVYDAKSSMEAAFYGLPMYKVQPATNVTLQAVPVQEQVAGNFSLTTTDATSSTPVVTTLHSLTSVTNAQGTYYKADGDSQATAGRVIQPKLALDTDARHPHPTVPPPVHGLLLTGGTYTDINPFDPVFARPTLEWEQLGGETQECQGGFSPANVGRLNSLESKGVLTQTAVVVPGQFRCTSGLAATATGIERLYNSLSFDLRRCASTDLDAPTIGGIDLRSIDATTVEVRVQASDTSGIARIIVLKVSNGSITPTELDLTQPLPTSGSFKINVSGVGLADELLVEVEDGACNVSSDTAKSAGLNFIKVDAGPDRLVLPGTATTLTSTVANFTNLTSPVSFLWNFGDGSFLNGLLAPDNMRTVNVTVDTFGTATFSVQHTYAPDARIPLTATLKVTDAAGGIGVDDVVFRCDPVGDAASANGDLVGCGASNTATTVTLTVRVDGVISNDFQYRINLDVGTFNSKTKTYKQPPDGITDVQLKYNGGQVTGLPSLQVVKDGSELRFTFNMADLGLKVGNRIQWFAETQGGLPGVPTAGKIDDMPDSGFFSYTLK